MRIVRGVSSLCAAVCLHAGLATAQSAPPLTLAEVLSLARTQAPRTAVARLAVAEAQGRLVGASRRLQSNPTLDLGLGNRQSSGGGRLTDLDVGVAQAFEPPSRRRARTDGAIAAIGQASADADDATRQLALDAAGAYYRALYEQERIRLFEAAEELALSVATAAERRFAVGDIPALDVQLARASVARARADTAASEANLTLAVGELQQLLGLGQPRPVGGALRDGVADVDANALLAASASRPDLRSLEAAVQEAESEQGLGRSLARPEYGFGARYAREEGDQIVMGTFTVTLPFFVKGQAAIATTSARATRLRASLDAARLRARSEVTAGLAAYQRRVAAIDVLERDALGSVDDTLTLATRSFDVGQIGLTDLLLIRRELQETRFQHLDALLEAALTRVQLDASAGVLR